MVRAAVATLILSAIALTAGAQTTVSGRVVLDDTGDPIPNARVTVASTALGTPVVLSDGEGRFTFTAPPGGAHIVASKSGYARRDVDPPTGSRPIEIRLRRGAAISGQVVDEFGDAVQNARVTAETVASAPANPTIVATADTDDRGEYRLAGLPSGAVTVAVVMIRTMLMPRGLTNNQLVFSPSAVKTYYPGVPTPDRAQELRLQPADAHPRIDFVVAADRLSLPPVVMARQLTGAPERDRASVATGVVRGRISSTDGRALPHAHVRLVPEIDVMQSQISMSDDDGRFEFRDVGADAFRVFASKSGYSTVASGEASFRLSDGETRERVDLSLARWGTITGRVLDELGDPLQGVGVQVLEVRYVAGRRRLVAAGGAVRVTDDLGRYRMYNLPPRQFIVSAVVGSVASAELPGYARSYYPGTPNAGSAQFVSVGVSQDVTGIDFSLSRTRTARVAGRILNAAGESTMSGSLQLMPSHSSATVTSVPVGARILPDATFEFPNVPDGQYVIQAYRGRTSSSTEGEFGSMPVSVNGADLKDLVLQTSSGSSIKGRFSFDALDRSKTPARSDIALSPIPVDFDLSPSNIATADIHADWSFEIAGVNGPRRLQLLRSPAGWAMKAINVGGFDVMDRPLPFGRKEQSLNDVEVVLTDRVNELRGTIADDRARPAPDRNVIVFSTDRDRWYPSSRFLRIAAAGADGAFTITGLPFGSYYAAAVAQLPVEGEDAWQSSEFLTALLPRSSTVTVGMGQNPSISLRLPAR
jgi:hypothetical protein